jgi:hypothetical protein
MEPLPPYPNFKFVIESKLATGVRRKPKSEPTTGRVKKWAEDVKVETVRVPGYWYNPPHSQIPPGARPQSNEKFSLSEQQRELG